MINIIERGCAPRDQIGTNCGLLQPLYQTIYD